MKQANLISIVDGHSNLSKESFEKYLLYFNINIKESELNDLKILCLELRKISDNINIFDNFFIGYEIPQIGKEFDFLRFDNDTLINLEIKRQATEEKVLKQLLRNKYYLNFIDKEILLFTYISSENKLYVLDKNDKLVEQKLTLLFEKLAVQDVKKLKNIINLFNPSNYLVSPFNSTESFIKNAYFLTSSQEDFKNQIINLIKKPNYNLLSIKGKAGCGKTLLTYDIGRELRNTKNVLFIHCANLNNGHYKLKNDFGWDIIPAKEIHNINYTNYEVIIIDEAQRIFTNQLNSIISKIKEQNKTCIFSYDKAQILRLSEKGSDILERNLTHKPFELTTKIRTNKKLANFIKCLFNKNERILFTSFPDIEIQYFENNSLAKKYINQSKTQGWQLINYTPEKNRTHYDSIHLTGEDENSHKVIGQEFDNVIVVIHSNFYYSSNLLAVKGSSYYNVTKMLFQNITRTKNKLRVVIINNEGILNRCIDILNKNNL